MKKRLRKKKHFKEFTEFGIDFDFYAEKLQNWFVNEGIKPPETYKIVDLWNDS